MEKKKKRINDRKSSQCWRCVSIARVSRVENRGDDEAARRFGNCVATVQFWTVTHPRLNGRWNGNEKNETAE